MINKYLLITSILIGALSIVLFQNNRLLEKRKIRKSNSIVASVKALWSMAFSSLINSDGKLGVIPYKFTAFFVHRMLLLHLFEGRGGGGGHGNPDWVVRRYWQNTWEGFNLQKKFFKKLNFYSNMTNFYLTKKIKSILSTLKILLGLTEEGTDSTTVTTTATVNFNTRNSFGMYSFKAALVFLFFVSIGVNAQTTYYSKASATQFANTASWGINADGSGTAPVSISNSDNFIIQNSAVLTLNANATVRSLTINAGTLNVAANTLNIGIASQKNSTFSLTLATSVLNVSGGTINIDGAFVCGSSTPVFPLFTQTGGDINIDGNSGSTATSASTALGLLSLFGSPTTLFLTGGRITILNPPGNAATSYAYYGYANTTTFIGAGHTIRFGDGTANQAGVNSTGFGMYAFPGSLYLFPGSIELANPVGPAANRYVNSSTSTIAINGNVLVGANSEWRPGSSTTYVAGNITNNGTLTVANTLYLGTYTGSAAATTTTSQTISGSGVFANNATLASSTANFGALTVNNISSGGVTFSNANSLLCTTGGVTNTGTVSGTLTFTACPVGVNLSGGTFIQGISTASAGTTAWTAGGFRNGSFKKWLLATTLPTTLPSTTVGLWPFSISGNNRNFQIAASPAATVAGSITVTHTNTAGLTTVTGTDPSGSYAFDRLSNSSWTVTAGDGYTGSNFIVNANTDGIYQLTAITNEPRLVQSAAAGVGTHVAATGTATTPVANRNALTQAQLTGAAFKVAATVANIGVYSVQSGNWEDGTTWSKGSAPSATDAVTIFGGHTITVNAAAAVAGTVTMAGASIVNVTGSTLSISSPAASGLVYTTGSLAQLNISAGTVTIGSTLTTRYAGFQNNGTLAVSGTGTLNVNGYLISAAGSTFSQTAGNINIDQNALGVVANSYTTLAGLQLATTNITLTGGTLTIVDPNPAVTTASCFTYSGASFITCGTSHTFKFGNGSSTDAGGNITGGFRINPAANLFAFGNLTFDGLNNLALITTASTSRCFTTNNTYSVLGNLTITSGEFITGSSLNIGGNISVASGATLSSTAALVFQTMVAGVATVNPNAQTVSGSGFFRNLAASPTANFNGITIRNSNASGVTFSGTGWNTGTGITGTVSGTLTFTQGVINTSSGVFTLGVSAASPGTLVSTLGGFTSGSQLRRWVGTGAIASRAITGQFPFMANNGTDVRSAFYGQTSAITGGWIQTQYNEVAGSTALTAFTDVGVSINTRSNSNWVTNTTGSPLATVTAGLLSFRGDNLVSVANFSNVRAVAITAAGNGTSVSGTGSNTSPVANKTALTTANLASTFYFGNSAVNTTTGSGTDWNTAANWSLGVPTACQDLIINHPIVVASASMVSGSVQVNSAGSLTINSGDLTVACTGVNNAILSNNGTLTVSGGTLNINGNLAINNGSTFNQSGGNINVDGNAAGVTANSVASGINIVSIGSVAANFATGTLNLTGGTLTIVDPHTQTTAPTASTDGYAFMYYASNGYTAGLNHTLQFGNGTSTDAGGSTNQFDFNNWGNTGLFVPGKFTANAGNGVSRFVNFTYNPTVAGDLTVSSGVLNMPLTSTTNISVGGNIVNNGTINSSQTGTGGLYFAAVTGTTAVNTAVNTVAQSVSGTGVYRNNMPSTTISAAGTGYAVGDILTVSGGTFTTAARFRVALITTGGVTIAYCITPGVYTVAPTNPALTTSNGAGTGCTLTLSNLLSTANFTNVIVNNNSSTGVTFLDANSLLSGTNTGTVSGTLTFTQGYVNTGSNAFTLGISAAAVGTLGTYTAGGFAAGSTFTRWVGTAIGGSTIAAAANPSGVTGRFPFIAGTIAAQTDRSFYYNQTVAATTGGKISVKYNDAATLSTVSFTDSAYNINRLSGANWVVSQTSITGTPTYSLAAAATNLYFATNNNTRLALSGSVVGTHAAGNATTILPVGQRTAVPLASLANTYYLGIDNADVPFVSVASTDWNTASTWNKNTVPTSTDNVIIANGTTVGVSTAAAAASIITVNGVLNVTAGDLSITGGSAIGATITATTGQLNISGGTVNIGTGATRYSRLTNNGTLAVTSSGILNVNGNLNIATGSTFTQSGGNINVDGNAGGVTANSVVTGTPLVLITNSVPAAIALTGGTLTVVDPHAGASTSDYAFSFSAGTAVNASPAHTLKFGNGVSTDAGGHTNGFYMYLFPGASYGVLGNVLVDNNATSARYRFVTTTSSIGILGNLTVNSGGEYRVGSTTYVAGNIVNNGILTSTSTLNFASYASATAAASTNAQTISGSGAFRNLVPTAAVTAGGSGYVVGDILTVVGGTYTSQAQFVVTAVTTGAVTSVISVSHANYSVIPTSPAATTGGTGTGCTLTTLTNLIPTASFGTLTVNNTNATGVTLSAPLSVSGTLTMTSGLINTTSTNLLTLGTTAAAGTLAGTPSATNMIVGPFARTFATRTAGGIYDATTLFPVGRGSAYTPVYVDPTIAAASAATISGEAFATNSGSGSADVSSLSAARWEVLTTSGFANLTDANIRVAQSGILSTQALVQAPTAAGVYDRLLSGTSAYAAGPILTGSGISATGFTAAGYFAYGVVAPPSVPTITSFTTAYSPSAPIYLCSNGGSVLTIIGTNLGGATSVLFNGGTGLNVPGTITAKTATSITVTTPSNIVDGAIRVVNPTGSGDSSSQFVVTDPSVVSVTANTTICSGSGTSLTASGANTYTWSPATGLSATTGATVTASPTVNTTYTVTGTNAAGCTATNTVTVTVSPTPTPIVITKNPATACIGNATTLTATGGANPGQMTGIIGTGTSLLGAAASYAAFNGYRNSSWIQTIYTAAELTAAGLSAGNINSLAYNINSQGSSTSNTITIKVGTTANSSFANTTLYTTTSYTTVYGPTSYSHTSSGLQQINFATPYVWDGISNIVVDVWQTGPNSSSDPETYYTVAADNKTNYTWNTAAGTAAATGNLTANRFNITFSGTNLIPQPLVWSPTTDLYSNALATTPYAGENLRVVYSKSTTPQTYTASATLGSCSATQNVTVTLNPLPTISVASVSICNGGSTPLAASGASTYSWSPATGLSATTGNLVTANPTATQIYTITGTDSNGCINTTTATVTVNEPVVITSQPTNAIVTPDTNATFTVGATATGVGYQWQVNTGSGWNDVIGATSASYTVTGVTLGMNGYSYRCVVSGTLPCASVTSAARTLNVSTISITAQPVNQIVCSNTSATFSIIATGVTAYQWQINTGLGWSDVSGENTENLVLSGIAAINSGRLYRCLLNGGAALGGFDSDTASLTVYDVVSIGTQPQSAIVCSNAASVTFTSGATGSNPTYQWQVSTSAVPTWTNIPSATAASYTINTPGVGLNNNQYRVKVSGIAPCSVQTSDVATLTVNQIVAITTQPTAVNQCSTLTTASFSVVASGTGLAYQWQYSTDSGATWGDYGGATVSTLTLTSPASFNGNSFRCIVSGAAPCTSLTSNAATLTVSPILGGTYTVGTAGNYATLAAAVAAYNNAACFSDNVVFSLTATSYDLGTTALTINQNANVGSYTLTIKPAAGVTAAVTGAVASGALLNIKANNVTIDGSNAIAGTSRDLTITNSSATAPKVVFIGNASTTLGNALTNVTLRNTALDAGTGDAVYISNDAIAAGYFTNITVRNNTILKGFRGIYANAVPSAGNGSGLLITQNVLTGTGVNALGRSGIYVAGVDGAIVSNNLVSNVTSSTVTVYGIWLATGTINTTVSGNTISNISHTGTGAFAASGIYVSNAATTTTVTVDNNTVSTMSNTGTGTFGGIVTFSPTHLTNNTVTGLSGAYSSGATYGMIASANTNATISGNTITDIVGTSSGSYYVYGMNVQGASANLNIFNNKISAIKCNHTSLYYSYGMYLTSSATTTNTKVYNNFIYDIESYGYYAYGLYLNTGNGYNVDHNTINMNTATSSMIGYPYALYISSSITSAASVNLRNNIIGITSTASSTQYPVYCGAASSIFGTIDYNDYYSSTTTLGYIGLTTRSSVADMTTGFGGNTHSVSVVPNFESATNMHLNLGTNTALDNLGTPLAAVTTDIDGTTRSATPDMGADEFTTLTCASQTLTAGTAISSVSGFCNSSTGVTVSASGYTIGIGTTYQWESSTDNITYIGIGTASAVYANVATGALSATIYYKLATICNGGSKVYSNVVTITKYTAAVTTVSSGVTICTGASTALTANGSSTYAWSPATGLSAATGASVTANPITTTTYTVTGTDANGCTSTATVTVTVNAYPSAVTITQGAASVCTNSVMSLTASGGTVGGSGLATLGLGASTSTSSGVNPFYGGYGGVKTQFLIQASELTALGMSAGNINSLALNLTTAGSTLNNLGISVGSTSLTALTSNIETGLSSVYTTASFVPSVGTNTFNFSSPYAWNGISNVIVSFCWSNGNTSNTVSTVSVDALGFNSSNARYVDSVVAADVCSYTGSATPSGWNGSATTGVSRPKMVFGYSTVQATPFTWLPTTELYTNIGGTTPYTGGPAEVVYTKPTISRTYTATASNGSCTTSSASTTVTPLALPSFTLTPVTICNGGSTTIVIPESGYGYSWSPATGLNTTSGATVTANPSVTTTYTVVGTNVISGCQKTQTVVVTVNNPPVVSSISPLTNNVAVDQATAFTVAASGTGLSYQWQVDDNLGAGMVNVVNDANYTGAATATLNIAAPTAEMNGYLYQCIVSGTAVCAPATSDPATLNVDTTGISVQPVSVPVCSGSSTSFTTVATSVDPEQLITYAWEVKVGTADFVAVADGLDLTTGLTFSGAETGTLGMSGTTFGNSGLIFHSIVNGYIFSSDATLTVSNPVAIGTQPNNQSTCAANGTVTFAVIASNVSTYAWQVSTNSGSSWAAVNGAVDSSLVINNPAASMNGNLYRVVLNGISPCSGATSNTVTLTVVNPTVTANPVDASVINGNAATFSVTALQATAYQWQYSATLNGVYDNVTAGTPVGTSYSGDTSTSLSVNTTIGSTPTGAAGYYRCIAANGSCKANSTGALLTVAYFCTPAPSSVDGTGITNVTMGSISNATGAEAGNYGDYTAYSTSADQLSTVNFAITYATGYAYGTKIWIDFNDNASFDDAGEQVYYGLSTNANPTTLSGSFTIPLTVAVGSHRMRIGGSDTDLGVGPCYASSYAAFEDYTFVVTPAPVCAGTPVVGTASAGQTNLCAGNSASLTLNGYTSSLGINLQWYSSTNNVNFAPISGQTSATLTTAALSANAYYYCAVTCANSAVTVNSNTVTITVSNPLITGSTPAGRCGTGTVALAATANDGSTINWYAAATGGSSLATGASFTTPSIAATTTYYAEAYTGDTDNASSSYSGTTNNGTSTGSHGIAITTTIPQIKIVSADIPFTGTGTLTIALKDATNTTVYSTVTTGTLTGLGTTALTIPLNITVPTAGNYLLIVNSVTGTVGGLGYSTVTYPLTALAGKFSVTSGYWYSATTSNMYLYNLALSAGCSSARTAVTATVTPTPTATISYTTPLCSSAGTASVTLNGTNAYTGGTYTSTAGLTLNGSTGAINVATSTPGTYTVTYSIPTSGFCSGLTATTSVTINQALTSGFAYDAATYCSNQGVITPTISGTSGAFAVSPSGLTLNGTTGAITLATSTAGTYTVTNTVVVAGCTNSVTSVMVTVNKAIAIASPPVSVSKLPSENTSFAVTASGTGLTYQWQVNTGSGWSNLSDDATYAGTTTATLSLTAVTAGMDQYQYQVIVSGATACLPVTSSTAILTVNDAAISAQPANFTACNQGATTATFAISTSGIATSFQWQVNTGSGFVNLSNTGAYSGADTATLSLTGLNLTYNNYTYRCVVNGAVYSNAGTLTVNTAVAIGTQPVATSVCTTGTTSLSVAATGTSLAYQWQVNSGSGWVNLANNATYSGVATATLGVTSPAALLNGYQYQVIVSGVSPCAAVTSTPVTLTVNTVVAVTTQPIAATICLNGNGSFAVAASGTTPTYAWEVNTGSGWAVVTNGGVYSNATTATLAITGAAITMNGYQYRAIVSGASPCGSVTSSAVALTISQTTAPIMVASSVDVCAGVPQLLSVTNPTFGPASIITSGTGTSSTNGTATGAGLSPNPMQSYYGGTRQQTLYTAAELTALGITNGAVLGSVAINLSAVETRVLQDYTVKMKNTTTTTFATSTFETGATTVRNAAGYQPVVGWNTLALDSNFTYTGGSLLVEFTFSNADGGGSGTNVATFNTTTNTATLYYRADSTSAVDVAAATTATYSQGRRNNMQFGVLSTSTTWSPTTGLYTDAAGTVPYTGQGTANVYAKINTSAIYTASNVNSLGCANPATVSVNVLTPSTLSSIAQPLITCSGSQTTFNLTGLLPNSTSTINYTINSVAQTAITSVVANASGNATFTVALSAVNNGRTLAITSLTRTNLTPSCTTAISANNTVVIAVQPTVTYYADTDGDTFGNNAVVNVSCQGQPAGYVTNNTDCNDSDATMNATYSFYADTDADGYGAGSAVPLCAVNATTPPAGYVTNNTDCNPTNSTKWQFATFYIDADGDGYDVGTASVCSGSTAPTGYATSTLGTDCNDSNATMHATYFFYADTDADGYGAGSAVSLCAVNGTTPPAGYVTNSTDCNPTDSTKWQFATFYIDADGDRYDAGTASVCSGSTAPTGYATSTLGTDCNDSNATMHATYLFYVDTDGDTYGTGTATLVCSASATVPPVGYSVNSTDCAPADATKWRTGLFYTDTDGDGYNNGAPQTSLCYGATTPVGYVVSNIGTDCLDSNFEVNPNHVEVMGNSIDDNCDGTVDEVAPTSSLQPNQCGITLTSIWQTLYANVITGAIAAQGYRFEVTEVGNPSNVRTYDSASNLFNLNNLVGGGVYNTTYSIRVAVKTAPGFWRAYAAACTVTTPAVAATTKVQTSQCGITLTNIEATIYCDAVINATGYRFRVTDGVTSSIVQTTVNRFSLSNANANFATTYAVDVQLKFGTTWETTWGTVCNITTPATPGTSNVSAAQCGINIANLWATIYATQVAVATGYRFEVTKGAQTVYYDTPNSRFSLRNITVPGFTTTNASYIIRVSIKFNNIYQAFGTPCTITTTGASRVTTTPVDVFEVKAYPNPFAANFKLEINTSSENNVGVKVYDMIGRQIEVRQSSLSQMTTLEIGDLYPTGVYNIVVTQGDKVKTLRVIKR